MALMNRRLEPEIETVFLMAGEEYSYVSSTLMKQVFELGGRVAGLIPELIESKMRDKLAFTAETRRRGEENMNQPDFKNH